jgi:O-antigen/teichoic acid export membrane protein
MGVIARQSIKASIVGLVGVAIGAFTRLFLYTKYLSSSEIGTLETLIKLGLIITPFVALGAPQVVIRYYDRFHNGTSDNGFIHAYVSLILFAILPLLVLFYVIFGLDFFSLYTEAPELKKYFFLPLWVAILYSGFNFLKSISVVHLKLSVPVFFNGFLDKLAVLLLLLFYGIVGGLSISQFIHINIWIFFGLPFVLMFLYLYFFIKPKLTLSSFSNSLKVFKETFQYNLYLVLNSFSEIIVAAIDINMIAGLIGTEKAGVYTIAFFMGNVIDIPKKSLTSIINPILNKSIINNEINKVAELYKKSSLNQFLVGSFMFLLVWLNIDTIFSIIPNGEIYKEGKLVVLYIGASKLFDMLMGVNKQIIELSGYYRYSLVNNILLGFLVISLNFIFINLDSPYFGGINGVAFASFLAILLSNLFSFALVWFKNKIQPFTWQHLKVFLPILFSIFLLSLFSFKNPFLSIVFSGFVLVLVFTTFSLVFSISKDFNLILRDILNKILKTK